MPNFRAAYLFFFLLLSGQAWGQKEYYNLEGTVVVRGSSSYKYELYFKEKRGKISGYSLTWLQPSEPSKALIEGKLDKAHKLISFSETEVVNAGPLKLNQMCLFNAVLTYKQTGKTFSVSGAFRGTDYNGKYCGEGSMNFAHAVEGDKILGTPPVKKQDPPKEVAKPLQVVEEKKEEPNVEQLTFGKNKELDWHSDSCILEVWDYGEQDGDVVTISVNGNPVISNLTMTSEKKILRFLLHEGANTISILAENEGRVPPNTARIQLVDGKRNYNLTAYNNEGNSASIILRKTK